MDQQINKLRILRAGESEKFFINSKFHEKIEEQSLGLLNLPTGIVANDPLCLFETEPLKKL